MMEACQELVNFLDTNGMFKSSKALKEEMSKKTHYPILFNTKIK